MKKQIYSLLYTGLLLPISASAVPLFGTATTDFVINGTTVASRPELAGVILEDKLSNFTISGAGETLSGIIQNRVVRSDVDGTLDFYWRIIPTSGDGDLMAFRVGGFDGFALNADWRTDGVGDIGPNIARYFGDGSGEVNFLFENEVGGNDISGYQTSKFFFLDTDAVNYNKNASFDLLCSNQNCISESYSTFGPATVPVPASVWLFVTGLIGLTGLNLQKKGKQI